MFGKQLAKIQRRIMEARIRRKLNKTAVIVRSEQLESGLTCMMCRKPKKNDGHTCCDDCAGLAF